MSSTMDTKKLKALANELAKDVKTPKDLNELSAFLTKLTVEAALNVEMDHHLGYDKHDSTGHHSGNSRNWYYSKKLKSDIARTYFYMSDRYRLKLSKPQKLLLDAWHKTDPVDEW